MGCTRYGSNTPEFRLTAVWRERRDKGLLIHKAVGSYDLGYEILFPMMKPSFAAPVDLRDVTTHRHDAVSLKEVESLESDNAALAALGYKQEFKRSFTALETFGFGFSIIGLLPSIS